MNTISWFIYLSDVLGSLGQALGGVTAFCTFISVVAAVLTLVSHCSVPQDPEKHYVSNSDHAFYNMRFTFKKIMITFIALTIVTLCVNIITPSKNTMLMIAASQTTEQVASSPQGQEVLNHLKTLINKKLTDMEK